MAITKEEFDEIMNRDSGYWEGDNVYQGLQILAKYVEDPTGNIILGASHDFLYGLSVNTLIKNGISKLDVCELRRLNWHVHNGYLACFI